MPSSSTHGRWSICNQVYSLHTCHAPLALWCAWLQWSCNMQPLNCIPGSNVMAFPVCQTMPQNVAGKGRPAPVLHSEPKREELKPPHAPSIWRWRGGGVCCGHQLMAAEGPLKVHTWSWLIHPTLQLPCLSDNCTVNQSTSIRAPLPRWDQAMFVNCTVILNIVVRVQWYSSREL